MNTMNVAEPSLSTDQCIINISGNSSHRDTKVNDSQYSQSGTVQMTNG